MDHFLEASELTFETVRDFMVMNGGRVTNFELVKYFRKFLTDPHIKEQAKSSFKDYVNTLATVQHENNEKFLILKARFFPPPPTQHQQFSPDEAVQNHPPIRHSQSIGDISRSGGAPMKPPPYTPPPNPYQNPSYRPRCLDLSASPQSVVSADGAGPCTSTDRKSDHSWTPPSDEVFLSARNSVDGGFNSPYGYDVSSYSPCSQSGSMGNPESTGLLDMSGGSGGAPPIPPRRHSRKREDTGNKENLSAGAYSPVDDHSDYAIPVMRIARSKSVEVDSDAPHALSVKEKTQHFNTRASESELNKVFQIHVSDHSSHHLRAGKSDNELLAPHNLSVKEKMHHFNSRASESELSKVFQNQVNNHLTQQRRKDGRHDKNDKPKDEEDAVSVSTLDQQTRDWLVKASQSNFQELTKMIRCDPHLVRRKDPTNGYTALHWAAKHGHCELVKFLAGTCSMPVNQKSHGGYTALHLAAQFQRNEAFDLLVDVYGADPTVRDHSGRKAMQYLMAESNRIICSGLSRKIKNRRKGSERDISFLRIGSLNVRVKKTTEVVSQFLGVNQLSVGRIHKSWGSADSVASNGDAQNMPPPRATSLKKRKSRRPQDFPNSDLMAVQRHHSSPMIQISQSRSTPTTPSSGRAVSMTSADSVILEHEPDSDSDGACGFGDNWSRK